ncbi:MAG: cytochrome P450 [Nostoc sp. EfeVER01]|uniref:cytochrome P450 n=1 Tax=unclassified Nostoc TaxID=2593658 RepID=UPI002AD37B1F|nr:MULTISPECIES: cytochrome P450 [unclassified Nostoc]MDZ7947160.1 cytochrome P450 [Nostoc sp. EfeVER01]MDZ7994697.1 cytochrome P450 [Nostoc sp. EspVER01]
MSSLSNLEQDRYNLSAPEVLANPYPTYRRILLEDPVYWSDFFGGWYLMRYKDVAAAMQDKRISAKRPPISKIPESEQQNILPLLETLSKWILFCDPPEHTRLRALFNKAFTPSIISSMAERIQTLVDELIDSVYEQGNMNIIHDLAYPMPAIVIAQMLGAKSEDWEQFKKWSDDLARFFGMFRMKPEILTSAQQSIIEMTEYFRHILEERRYNPQDDLMSSLIFAQEKGNSLDDDEILSNCVFLTFAGHETTTNLIANGLLALLKNPSQMQKLKDDPSLITTTVEEFLRYDSPVQRQARIAVTNLEIDGKQISQGQRLFLVIGAANRDPEQFLDPDKLDITRPENPHLAFGKGTHFCLGASLGRLEAQIAINTIVRRLSNLHLDTDRIEWHQNPSLRGMKSMPVAFNP